MALWGVEVKPGKPYTHIYDDSKGRLHVSMATLGSSSRANEKSTLQCNVGRRRPVFLCSLYPRHSESMQLNLEFEQQDRVVFSVIGPTSIHLSGYYLSTPSNANAIRHLDDSDSYGEDIEDTETGSSDCSDDEDNDDSFIDDDTDPEVFSSPPSSKEEEASHDNTPKGKKGSFRRLRKNCRLVVSDDDCDEEKIVEPRMEDFEDKKVKKRKNQGYGIAEDKMLAEGQIKSKKKKRKKIDEDNGDDGEALEFIFKKRNVRLQ